jgi:hypothetical protein
VAMGWLNPTHAIARRAFPDGVPDGVEVIVAMGARPAVEVWSAPDDPEPVGELALVSGDRYALLEIDAGADDTDGTSAEAYRLWYRIVAPGIETPVWVRALVPAADATGSDGRPSSVRFDFLPYAPRPEG